MNLRGAQSNSYGSIYDTEMFLASVVSKPGCLSVNLFLDNKNIRTLRTNNLKAGFL